MNTFWLVIKGVLTGAVGPGISVMYATYGEVVTERSGKINLGVEGAMLMGACFGFIAAAETESEVIGVLSGALAGGVLSLFFAFMVISRRANQLATGLAIGVPGLVKWGLPALFAGMAIGTFLVAGIRLFLLVQTKLKSFEPASSDELVLVHQGRMAGENTTVRKAWLRQ